MALQQQQQPHVRVTAEWVKTKRRCVCGVCHTVCPPRSDMVYAAHHAGANQAWTTFHVCAKCVPSVESNLGIKYPGDTPAA